MFQRGSYTGQMFETRLATEADAELIGAQRRRMFAEMGRPEDERMRAMLVAFVPWVRERIDKAKLPKE